MKGIPINKAPQEIQEWVRRVDILPVHNWKAKGEYVMDTAVDWHDPIYFDTSDGETVEIPEIFLWYDNIIGLYVRTRNKDKDYIQSVAREIAEWVGASGYVISIVDDKGFEIMFENDNRRTRL